MYHILIVGTGFAGGTIARYFVQKKQKVYGLVQSAERAEALQGEGIIPCVADLTRPESLEEIPRAHFVVLSPAPRDREQSSYEHLYLDGIGHFLKAYRRHPKPHLIVYLSSSGVWAERGGDWVDEEVVPDPQNTRGRILLEAERQVLKSAYPSVIFRLAGIYGPGRNRIAKVRQGDIPEGDDRYMNMIHVEDIAGAMPVLFNRSKAGSVYAGVDDEPVRQSEFFGWLTSKLGVKSPDSQTDGQKVGGKRIRNAKLKSLGFSFKYPTFREGYEALFETETMMGA